MLTRPRSTDARPSSITGQRPAAATYPQRVKVLPAARSPLAAGPYTRMRAAATGGRAGAYPLLSRLNSVSEVPIKLARAIGAVCRSDIDMTW